MSEALRRLQRLADRTVQRYGKISAPLSKIDVNHLRALVTEIESTYNSLLQDFGGIDELDLVEAQLSLLNDILSNNDAAAKSTATLSTMNDDEGSDSDDQTPLIKPQSSHVDKDSRFALGLRQRPLPKQRKDGKQKSKAVTTDDQTIFRPEHDELSRDLLDQSFALKANSNRMATLLKEDANEMTKVERLMDTTEGDFAGHAKKLAVQTKTESWGLLWTACILVFGFLLFLFMFVFISIS